MASTTVTDMKGNVVKMEVDYSNTVDKTIPECEKMAGVSLCCRKYNFTQTFTKFFGRNCHTKMFASTGVNVLSLLLKRKF